MIPVWQVGAARPTPRVVVSGPSRSGQTGETARELLDVLGIHKDDLVCWWQIMFSEVSRALRFVCVAAM